MSAKTTGINCKAQIGEVNSVAQAILGEVKLLGEDASEHLLGLLARVELGQQTLNLRIKEDLVRSESRQLFRQMKQAFKDLHVFFDSCSRVKSLQGNTTPLFAVVNKYRSSIMGSTNMMLCNSDVTSLLSDLSAAEMVGWVEATMYAGTMLDALKSAQSNFLIKYMEYRNLRKAQIDRGNASKERKRLVELVNRELLLYLDAMEQVESVDYDAFTNSVRSIIASRNTIIKRRLSKSGADVADAPAEVEA
ncbi:MAG: hypothetical protein ACK5LR_01165 [Mangrovibacterium sp.]